MAEERSICGRAERYIRGLSDALNALDKDLSKAQADGTRGLSRLLDAVKRYLGDADHFIKKGDCETALVAVSYAEGLLDALGYLGILEIPWGKPYNRRKVFVAGTFDIIHPGHIELLRYAASLGDVYVVVSRDTNALKAKKRPLVFDENTRLKIISSIRYVYKARLGDERDYLKPIEEIRPDVIVLGPDQPFSEKTLGDMLEARLGYRPLITRFKGKIHFSGDMRGSSDVIREICRRVCPLLGLPNQPE